MHRRIMLRMNTRHPPKFLESLGKGDILFSGANFFEILVFHLVNPFCIRFFTKRLLRSLPN
jgi:hypothetical protein